jgi:hypothetical protein
MTADERLALIRRKVEWAETHFQNLEVVKNRFIERTPYTIGSEPDSKAGHEGLHRFFPTSFEEVDPNIALIAGDIIHNLRSALDHLACHLVAVAGNPILDETAFPIFRGDEIHEATFRRKVEGMRDSAKNKIRATEPYEKGKGRNLWALHRLDIADKHHALLTIPYQVSGIIVPSREGSFDFVFPRFAAPNFGDALEIGKTFVVCTLEDYKNMKIPFDVAITEPNVIEPKPILWAMRFAIDMIDNLIIDFKSELV